ncbi:serine hydrolase [Bacillus subtilis]|uniref:serine hydrolase n=1 Tax=Bacillus subtilis TaxID=1423 RepID=UPI00301B633C
MNEYSIYKKLLYVLNKKEECVHQEVAKLVSPIKKETEIKALSEIITGLKLGSVRYTYDGKNDVIKISDQQICGEIKLKTDSEGFLDKMWIIPHTPDVLNVKSLNDAFMKLDASFKIIFSHNGDKESFVNGKQKNFAVSSLVKIAVTNAVYEAANEKVIDLDSKIEIFSEDLSVLTAGLSEKDVGEHYSIKELLSLMLLVSDNSAMDILIKVIGKDRIRNSLINIATENRITLSNPNINFTKEIFGGAWCYDNTPESTWRDRALKNVAWVKDFDYFIPLEMIVVLINKIIQNDWVPWDELKQTPTIIYKGGSAPGVLSALWSTRHIEEGKVSLIFSLNRTYPLTIIEELYIFECANKLLTNIGMFNISEMRV